MIGMFHFYSLRLREAKRFAEGQTAMAEFGLHALSTRYTASQELQDIDSLEVFPGNGSSLSYKQVLCERPSASANIRVCSTRSSPIHHCGEQGTRLGLVGHIKGKESQVLKLQLSQNLKSHVNIESLF